MTSWIDASFVYSTNEAWVNAMRTFVGGSLKMEGDSIFGMPSRNVERVPLANHPAPHVLRMLDPERMYCKYWNTNLPISPLLVINECNSSQNCKLISKKWNWPAFNNSIDVNMKQAAKKYLTWQKVWETIILEANYHTHVLPS